MTNEKIGKGNEARGVELMWRKKERTNCSAEQAREIPLHRSTDAEVAKRRREVASMGDPAPFRSLPPTTVSVLLS